MSNTLICDTTSANAMFWTVLSGNEVRCSGNMRRIAPPPPEPPLPPLDIYASIASLATSFSATVNLLPGDDGARNSAQAASHGWSYNAALTAAQSAAITAARLLP